MELKCRNCGALIPAENINIQELLAVCSRCNHVFEFNRSAVARKPKPHKLKPPARLRVYEDDDRLELSYRLVLGPGPRFGLIMSTIGAVALPLIIIGAARDGAPALILLFFGLLAFVMWYLIAAFLTTTTRISADENQLEIQSGPLPFPASDDKSLRIHDVKRVFFEQTLEAWPPGMPTHHVYAELQDGSRVTLVTSLPYDHAHYIARVLEEFLHPVGADDLDVSEEDDVIESAYESLDDSLSEDVLTFHQDQSR
jgi:hypothetical protein